MRDIDQLKADLTALEVLATAALDDATLAAAEEFETSDEGEFKVSDTDRDERTAYLSSLAAARHVLYIRIRRLVS